jgi:hypothetical protein
MTMVDLDGSDSTRSDSLIEFATDLPQLEVLMSRAKAQTAEVEAAERRLITGSVDLGATMRAIRLLVPAGKFRKVCRSMGATSLWYAPYESLENAPHNLAEMWRKMAIQRGSSRFADCLRGFVEDCEDDVPVRRFDHI